MCGRGRYKRDPNKQTLCKLEELLCDVVGKLQIHRPFFCSLIQNFKSTGTHTHILQWMISVLSCNSDTSAFHEDDYEDESLVALSLR